MRRIFPKENDTRIVKRFLWSWKTINDEMRRWEFASWQEKFERVLTDNPEGSKGYYCAWQPVKWVNY